MLRNYYGYVTILLLFAKTLAERFPNINKIEAAFKAAFFSARRLRSLCAGFFFLYYASFSNYYGW